jgi:osmotically-inducible protein OsmY
MNESDVRQPFETLDNMTEQSNGSMMESLASIPSPGATDDTDLNDTGFHVAEILEDLRLTTNVERALQTTGHLPLRGIQVSVCGRAVSLQGRVPSYYLKQMAQITAFGILGIEGLRNDLEVVGGGARR